VTIGENIRRLRESKRLTQDDLAKAINVSASIVSHWEADKRVPRMGNVERMAQLFDVLKSDIIEGPIEQGRTLVMMYDRLSEEGKKKATSYVRFLVQAELQDSPKP